MTLIRKYSLRRTIYLLAFGLSLISARASAQSVSQGISGQFVLSTEARWSTTVLTPGSYWFSLDGVNTDHSYAVITIGSGKRVVGAFISHGHFMESSSGHNYLTMARSGDTTVVRSLELPELGVVFSFPLPKPMPLIAAQTASPVRESRSIPGK